MHLFVPQLDNRSEAERLLDLGRVVRHAAGCPSCMRELSKHLTIDRMAHALKFAKFADELPGETFQCLIEEWDEQRIVQRLY